VGVAVASEPFTEVVTPWDEELTRRGLDISEGWQGNDENRRPWYEKTLHSTRSIYSLYSRKLLQIQHYKSISPNVREPSSGLSHSAIADKVENNHKNTSAGYLERT
jgi:hypothetical protein